MEDDDDGDDGDDDNDGNYYDKQFIDTPSY